MFFFSPFWAGATGVSLLTIVNSESYQASSDGVEALLTDLRMLTDRLVKQITVTLAARAKLVRELILSNLPTGLTGSLVGTLTTLLQPTEEPTHHASIGLLFKSFDEQLASRVSKREQLTGVAASPVVQRLAFSVSGISKSTMAFAASATDPDGPLDVVRELFAGPLIRVLNFLRNLVFVTFSVLSGAPGPSGSSRHGSGAQPDLRTELEFLLRAMSIVQGSLQVLLPFFNTVLNNVPVFISFEDSIQAAGIARLPSNFAGTAPTVEELLAVPAGVASTIRTSVASLPATVAWSLRVESYDIGFKLEHHVAGIEGGGASGETGSARSGTGARAPPSDRPSARDGGGSGVATAAAENRHSPILIPFVTFSSEQAIQGAHSPALPGTYVFTVDNTHSYFRGKTVQVRIVVYPGVETRAPPLQVNLDPLVPTEPVSSDAAPSSATTSTTAPAHGRDPKPAPKASQDPVGPIPVQASGDASRVQPAVAPSVPEPTHEATAPPSGSVGTPNPSVTPVSTPEP